MLVARTILKNSIFYLKNSSSNCVIFDGDKTKQVGEAINKKLVKLLSGREGFMASYNNK